MRFRALVFDLWQTLVPYDRDARERVYREMARHIGAPEDRFVELRRAASGRRGGWSGAKIASLDELLALA